MTAIYFFFGCCWLVFSLDDLIYNMNLNPHNWFYVVWCGFIDWFIDWLHELLKVFFLCFDWLVDWVSFWFDSWLGWWTHWFIDSLSLLCLNWVAFVDWLIDWNLKLKLKLKLIVWCNLIGWLIDWSVDCLIDCFIDWLMFRFWHEANFHTYFSLRVGSRKRWMYVGGNPQTSPMWFLEQLGVYQMKS